MSLLHVMYGAILLILIVSIILGLANWFFLSSVSSQVSAIEQEVDKKAQEFDIIRKERQNAPSQSVISMPDENQGYPGSDFPHTEQPENSNQIEIVRNVGGVFESADQHTSYAPISQASETHQQDQSPPLPGGVAFGEAAETVVMKAQRPMLQPGVPDQPPATFDITETPSAEQMKESLSQGTNDDAVSHGWLPESASDTGSWPKSEPIADTEESHEEPVPALPEIEEPGNTPAATETAATFDTPIVSSSPPPLPAESSVGSDVLDIVGETPVASDTADRFRIQLYSGASKDADFVRAWKTLADIMGSSARPEIHIDFENIHFLYDKEIMYLERMSAVVENQNGAMHFVNCDPELAELIDSRPSLAPLVRKETPGA